MDELGRSTAPAWAYWLCYLIIALPSVPYVVALDRYPEPFVDESFFNYPAMSFLDGNGLVYKVRDDAPHGDRLWAYHAPFFPRLQVPVLAFWGVGQWSFRITELVAAILALLVLCRTLLGQGFPWSAVTLAVIWVGDRSSQEVLLGRMEGLYLLCLAIGFWALSGPVSAVRSVLAGSSLAAAFGFHPVTMFFPIAGGIWVLSNSGKKQAAWFTVGVAVPATAFIACWLPDVSASLEQFVWTFHLCESCDAVTKWMHVLFVVLGWSKFWINAVIVAIVALGIRSGLRAVCHRGTDGLSAPAIGQLAVVFGVCGLAGCLFIMRGAFFPYYVVVLTVWPVIAIATEVEGLSARRLPNLTRIIAVSMALCWLPSLAWNTMRLREILLFYPQMDTSAFHTALKSDIPAGAPVSGQPVLLGHARGAGVPFRPIPWHGLGVAPPDDAWLLITENEYLAPRQLSETSIRSRPVIRRMNIYQEGCPLEYRVVLLGPHDTPQVSDKRD